MRSIFCVITLFLVIGLTISCSPVSRPNCVEIYGEDIPIFPNAQNITKDGPIKDWRESYTWDFTTTDNPEKVWEFYVNELTEKWGGVDFSSTQTPEEKVLHLEKACKFTYLIITTSPIDATTYRITIKLFKEPSM